MSNIAVRKQNGGTQVAPPARSAPALWDPFRAMRELMAWDPFREMAPALAWESRPVPFVPAFEVKETQDAFLFKGDLPGVKPEDIEVHLTGNYLTISGKREAEQEEQTDTYYACERSYGSFTRGFTLPGGADGEHIRAELKQGVLTVAIPKKPEAMPKKVPVQAEKAQKS